MKARILLAALHFNENGNRNQSVTALGEKRWAVSFPKYKDGAGILKQIKVPMTYNYVDDLWDAVMELRQEYPTYAQAGAALDTSGQPSSLADSMEDEDNKHHLISYKKSRFSC